MKNSSNTRIKWILTIFPILVLWWNFWKETENFMKNSIEKGKKTTLSWERFEFSEAWGLVDPHWDEGFEEEKTKFRSLDKFEFIGDWSAHPPSARNCRSA